MTLSELGAFSIAITGVTTGASVFALGDVVPLASDVTAEWVHVVGGMTSLGFAVWYAWCVTTKVMPEKDRVHADTIKDLVEEFRNEVKEQREFMGKPK